MVLESEVGAAAPKPVWEVADVFRRHFDDYLKQHHCTAQEFKAVNAILRCRTAAMGGYIRMCDTCGNVEVAYCSCKNRHCPKCGHFEKAQWVAKQEARLLPMPHFQVVFTVDHGINDIAHINPKAIYTLLFRVAGKLLKEYGRRYLGGDIGATMVPHTWGQTLQHHIHLHCMVPAGALVKTSEGYRWQESGKTFLMPVLALSEEFRDAFCNGVLKLYGQGELRPAGSGSEWEVEETVRKMRAKKWEVYIRKPPAGTDRLNLLDYLGRYVQRTAISNRRIVEVADGQVTFEYKDNRDKDERNEGKRKQMTLSAVEFMRRFLLHVLPKGFVRIRHYGLYASGMRTKLRIVRMVLGCSLESSAP
ncbi:MAG: IS91 family transposase, partial [Caldilineaceae bacterium]|nr:IS91 family transposase [Caldilineaceae bacterium]